MAVSIWEGNKAQALIDAIASNQKVDKFQGSGNAGKVLTVGEDGYVINEKVFTARIILAFANALQHVIYDSPESSRYYTGLINALIGGSGGKTVESISAVYDTTHSVFSYETVDALKDYITVTALYSDGTTEEIDSDSYVLSGELSQAESVVTVSYLGNITTITVPVFVDNSLIYHIQRGYVFDGTSATKIDTGVKFVETNMALTLLFDITDNFVFTTARGNSFISGVASVPDPDNPGQNGNSGCQIGVMSTANGTDFLKHYNAFYCSGIAYNSADFANVPHRLKGALKREANSMQYSVLLYVDDVLVSNDVTNIGKWLQSDTTLFVGARPNGFAWNGTANILHAYNRVLTSSEIKDILEVE